MSVFLAKLPFLPLLSQLKGTSLHWIFIGISKTAGQKFVVPLPAVVLLPAALEDAPAACKIKASLTKVSS